MVSVSNLLKVVSGGLLAQDFQASKNPFRHAAVNIFRGNIRDHLDCKVGTDSRVAGSKRAKLLAEFRLPSLARSSSP